MRAARFETAGSIRVADIDDPTAGPGEVLVEVTAAGMCGSDRHIVRGTYPASPPVTLGHEIEGVVRAAGPDCTMSAGERVAVDPNISCRLCTFCRAGLPAHCTSLRAIGVNRDGGLAEYVTVPESQAYPLPPSLPEGLGALCEPLACCLRALDHAEISPGESVAVLGGGVIGQLLVQLSRLAGAAEVILVTRQEARRKLAESLGATRTVDPEASADLSEVVAGPGGLVPGGVHVAFEAAGVPGTFRTAIAVTRPAGRVTVVGAAAQGSTVEVEPYVIFARELRVQGSFLNPLTHGRAADLAGRSLLTLEPLVTRRVPLDEVPAVLLTAPRPGDIKILAVPR